MPNPVKLRAPEDIVGIVYAALLGILLTGFFIEVDVRRSNKEMVLDFFLNSVPITFGQPP